MAVINKTKMSLLPVSVVPSFNSDDIRVHLSLSALLLLNCLTAKIVDFLAGRMFLLCLQASCMVSAMLDL